MFIVQTEPKQLLSTQLFQKRVHGKQNDLYFLNNANGFTAAITNYGARIVGLFPKDSYGCYRDVIMGYASIDDYLSTDERYHGAIVGRYANRIACGKFNVAGQEYRLGLNNYPNSLHGGPAGFDACMWETSKVSENEIELIYLSKDGEEGFPGNLDVKVTYTVTEEDTLKISFEATTDLPTVLNITNHSYFNLNGQGSGSAMNHSLQINADAITPVDTTLIPLGTYMDVTGTPFDFRRPNIIGTRIADNHEQIKLGGGYDHNFVLNKQPNETAMTHAATAIGEESKIKMDVYTTEPGVQLYTGNFLKGANTLKYNLKDTLRSGFCLETQHFPDSPNQPAFPTTLLESGAVFKSETEFRFSVVS